MFGILDVILGLAFIYLLLSLIVSAINEYLASMLNKRGKVLMTGLHRLLADTGLKDDFFRHPLIRTYFRDREKLLEHERRIGRKWPLAKTLYRLFTWAFRPSVREARYPSYLPARTFAMAMLEVAQEAAAKASGAAAAGGSTSGGAAAGGAGSLSGASPGGAGAAGGPGTPPPAPAPAPVRPEIDFQKILEALRRDAGADVTEFAELELATALAGSTLVADVKERLIDWALGTRNEAQKLHDSLEVWFNNAMDRVSGAYKRHTQYVLFWIGVVLAFVVNADTVDLWRRLSTDDKLRDGIAAQAASAFHDMQQARIAAQQGSGGAQPDDTSRAAAPAQGDAPNGAVENPEQDGRGVLRRRIQRDTLRPADQDSAKALYVAALAELDQTGLNLGWTQADALELGLLKRRAPAAERPGPWWNWIRGVLGGEAPAASDGKVLEVEWRPWFWYRETFWPKFLGLLITAFALSMGAPFWFDLLNKVINIRAAGRAPHEKAVSPEAGGKRPADVAPK